MSDGIKVRHTTRSEWREIAEVWHDAVRKGASDYTPAQRAAWSPAPMTAAEVAARLAEQTVMVAVEHRTIVGVMTLRRDGYVDLAYVRASHQGRGLFRRLYTPLEAEAKACSRAVLRTHASLMARRAFEAVGFEVVKSETVELRGQHFDRFEMKKNLRLAGPSARSREPPTG